MDWFLYDNCLPHERVKGLFRNNSYTIAKLRIHITNRIFFVTQTLLLKCVNYDSDKKWRKNLRQYKGKFSLFLEQILSLFRLKP